MVEYLVTLLLPDYRVAVLSRGYGRSTRGFRVASRADTAQTIGDEPMQYYNKFGDRVPVVVCEDRAMAIPLMIDQFPDTDVVILDDAYQHRRVKASFNVLLTEFSHPFYKDFVLPTGMLREWRSGARRAQVVVVSKTPDSAAGNQLAKVSEGIGKYADCPVCFSSIRYHEPVAIDNASTASGQKAIAVTGIANAQPFLDHVAEKYEVVKHFAFRDHHPYSLGDVEEMKMTMAKYPGAIILTTEKDITKLSAEPLKQHTLSLPLFYVPIAPEFVGDGSKFDTLVRSVVEAKTKNRD